MTYSIVAHDPETGAMGVAVQSHWFNVGGVVTWARAGVGAVATQSVVEPAYGLRLLDRLAAGTAPRDALAQLLADDPTPEYRQVAVVGVDGDVAVHTGERCIAYAGHADGRGYSAQANIMASEAVWPAMARAYEQASGPLQRRLAVALHAAEAAGGDVRGRQSAALVVVPATGEAHERLVDVRVDDHPEPLAELDRLLDLTDAYGLATEGDDLTAEGRLEEAGDRYERASALAPGNHELLFWSGMGAANSGDMPTALARVREAIAVQPGWRDLLGRLGEDVAPSAAAVLAALDG
ncbi:hypothetical protein DSM112329_00504 [Paraconexibacter sp. AEG42_29]|uniref:DUF1028 domain-containing protein n=1 Tax=Paraconexibacter sp. AEG42_29 TaxID=2997339 RepID=A0AAU7AQ37_9ACTN